MWTYLLTAVALVLVLEGILPFLSPQTWRQMMAKMAEQNDRVLRILGLCSMVAGAVIMYLVHFGIF